MGTSSRKMFLVFCIFGLGVLSGYLIWDSISLPFKNPFQVVGYCTKIQFNPSNDVLRFCLFVSLPSFLLLLMAFLKPHWILDSHFHSQRTARLKPIPESGKTRLLLALLVGYAVLIAINVPTYHAFGRFDSYHEGESLGSAVSDLQGEKPYQDFLFFHGMIQDPLRSVWAFALLGKGIAAERVFESALKILAWIGLALLLCRLFQKDYWWAFGGLSVLAVGYVSFCFNILGTVFVPVLNPENLVQAFFRHQFFWAGFNFLIIPARDFLTFIFIFIFLILTEWLKEKKSKASGLFRTFSFLLSFVPVIALGYSVDRGVYLTAATFLLFVIFGFSFAGHLKRSFLLFFFVGLIAGLALLSFWLQGAWGSFLRFTFVEMPRFKELSEKIPCSIHQIGFFSACVLIAVHFYRLVWNGLRSFFAQGWGGVRIFFTEHLVEITLFTLSVFYFRNVLVRADLEHLIYSLLPLYLLTFYILFQTAKVYFSKSSLCPAVGKTTVVLLTGFILILALVRDGRSNVIAANFPVGEPDDSFVLKNQQDLVEKLKPLIHKDDGFFTFTSEASWYYLLDQPCPTRYPYLWIAAPKPAQEEVVRDLADKKVKWILYRDEDWSYRVDGIGNDEKFPVVNEFILKNYRPYFSVEGNEVWVLKGASEFLKKSLTTKGTK